MKGLDFSGIVMPRRRETETRTLGIKRKKITKLTFQVLALRQSKGRRTKARNDSFLPFLRR